MPRALDPARFQKEIEAQKKRAAALAHLKQHGCEPIDYQRHATEHGLGGTAAIRGGIDKARDNTLTSVAQRKAQQRRAELSARDSLIKQQTAHREAHAQAPAAAAAATATAAAAAGHLQVLLPAGWTEVKDPSTGDAYYWNKTTGATSWDRPSAATADAPLPSKEAAAGPAAAMAEGGRGGSEVAGEGQGEGAKAAEGGPGEEAQGQLAHGWEEIKDPASGAVYYWNRERNATTWVRPVVPKKADGSAAPGQALGDGGDGAGGDGLNGLDADLPDGWERTRHAATGQQYYVHRATGRHSWGRPGSTEGADGASQSGPAEASSGPAGSAEQGQARARPGTSLPSSSRPRKKGRVGGGKDEDVDPLDPTGQKDGKWSDGLARMGERMADSTASGPLWQQRPYPAPGQILRGRK